MTRIVLLSVSRIGMDPRVRRQGETLFGAGLRPIGVGIGPPVANSGITWPIHCLDIGGGLSRRAGTAARGAAAAAIPKLAGPAFWTSELARDMHQRAVEAEPALVIANDWRTLPIAIRLLNEHGIPFVYDSHEMGVHEFASRWWWRTLLQPYVASIERMAISHASVVTTVSPGIASALAFLYKLPETPTVVRNVPLLPDDFPFPGRTSPNIEVLYHGLFTSDRHLDVLIRSVAQWSPSISLVLRGGLGPPRYEASLRSLVRRLDLESRVSIVGPAPPSDLVRKASASSIGIFLTATDNIQKRHALPNKVFEYIVAGLGIIVSDTPELRDLTDRFGVGLVVPNVTPHSIATTVNSLDVAMVNSFHKNAIASAEANSWVLEEARFLSVIERALSTRISKDGRLVGVQRGVRTE